MKKLEVKQREIVICQYEGTDVPEEAISDDARLRMALNDFLKTYKEVSMKAETNYIVFEDDLLSQYLKMIWLICQKIDVTH